MLGLATNEEKDTLDALFDNAFNAIEEGLRAAKKPRQEYPVVQISSVSVKELQLRDIEGTLNNLLCEYANLF